MAALSAIALLLLAAAPLTCTHRDPHGHVEPCAQAARRCPEGQHYHSPSDFFTVQKNIWSPARQVAGDGLCHENGTDLVKPGNTK